MGWRLPATATSLCRHQQTCVTPYPLHILHPPPLLPFWCLQRRRAVQCGAADGGMGPGAGRLGGAGHPRLPGHPGCGALCCWLVPSRRRLHSFRCLRSCLWLGCAGCMLTAAAQPGLLASSSRAALFVVLQPCRPPPSPLQPHTRRATGWRHGSVACSWRRRCSSPRGWACWAASGPSPASSPSSQTAPRWPRWRRRGRWPAQLWRRPSWWLARC